MVPPNGKKLSTNPDSPMSTGTENLLKAGIAKVNLRELPEAIEILTKVLEDEPNNSTAYDYRGFALRMSGYYHDIIMQ